MNKKPKQASKPKLIKPLSTENGGENKISDKDIKDDENDKSKLKSQVLVKSSRNKESGIVLFENIEAEGYRYYRSFLISNIPSFKIDSNGSNSFYGNNLGNIRTLENLYQQLEEKFSIIDKVIWIHILGDQDKAVITFEKQLNPKKRIDLKNNKLLVTSKLNRMGQKLSINSTFLTQYSMNYKFENCFPVLNDECFLNVLKYLKFYDHMHLFVLSKQNRKLIFKYYESNSTLKIDHKDFDVKILNASWCVLKIIGPSISKVIFEYDNCYDLGMEGFIQSILYYTKNIKELKLERDPKSDLLNLQYFIKEKKLFAKLNIFENIKKIELIRFGNKGQELTDLDIKNLASCLPEIKILNLSQNENITGQHFYLFKSITELNIAKCYKILCCHMMEFIKCNKNKLEYLNIIDCLNLCGNEFWDNIQAYAANLRILKFSIMPSLKLPKQLHKLDYLRNLTEVYIGNGEKIVINYNHDILDVLETLTLSKCVRRVEVDSTIQFHIKVFLLIINLLKKDKIRENNTNKIRVKLGVTIDPKHNFQNDCIYLENRKNIKLFESTAEEEGLAAAEYTFRDDNLY